MEQQVIAATQAIITHDVAIPALIWGWMITLNMWAKSIGTGVVLVGAFLWYRHNKEELPGLRWIVPVVSFIFLNVFLFFTLTDLHQPYRMIHIFTHPHWTSAITVGAWMATLFLIIIAIMALIGFSEAFENLPFKGCKVTAWARKKSSLYDKLLPFAVVLAIPVTLYTAIIMAQASARELWVAPVEMAQMLMAALIAGSSTLIFFAGRWSDEVKKSLALTLMVAAFISFAMYFGEYFFSFKSLEAEAALAYIHPGGEYFIQFWAGMVLGLIIPFIIAFSSLKKVNYTLLRFGALLALIGLYLSKDVWLKIPQMIPLS